MKLLNNENAKEVLGLTNSGVVNKSAEGKHPKAAKAQAAAGGKTHLANSLGMVAAKNRYSTYYINCHTLMEQLKKSHYENRLPDKLKIPVRYKVLIIDEIGYLPMDIQGASLLHCELMLGEIIKKLKEQKSA